MLKKGLFAIALLGLFAVSAQALCTTYNIGMTNTGGSGWVKIDPQTDPNFNTSFNLGTWYKQWPGTVSVCTNYTAIDLCCIPVWLEVGMYAEVYKCGDQKITLKQVPCFTGHTSDYPCYQGCTNVGVRGNFPMLLGLKKDNLGGDPNAGSILPTSNWSVKFVAAQAGYAGPQPGTNFVAAGVAVINSGNNATIPPGLPGGANSYYLTAICVQAWKANLMYNLFSNPGMSAGPSLIRVGTVCITVQPQ